MGEIVVRGNVVMKGYFNDPEATAQALRGGWFHTGDAAVVHPDGYVEIRDRLKDVIISGGENISSVEVEGVLLRHPAVQEVAIVGLPHEKWGEAPHAFVVLRAGAQADAEELRAFARAHLAHFKAPHDFTFLAELPKTATGKVQKYVLRGGTRRDHEAVTDPASVVDGKSWQTDLATTSILFVCGALVCVRLCVGEDTADKPCHRRRPAPGGAEGRREAHEARDRQ